MCAPCCYSFRVISTSVNPKPLRDSAIYGNLQAWLCGDQTGLVCVSLHITEATVSSTIYGRGAKSYAGQTRFAVSLRTNLIKS